MRRRTKPITFLIYAMLLSIFIRWWLYWEALFSIPIGPYLVYFSEFVVTGGVLILLINGYVEIRNFTKFAILLFYFLLLHGFLVTLFREEYRILDIIISAWYVTLPFLFISVLPFAQKKILKYLLALTLGWFSIQVIFGSLGLLIGISQTLVYDEYANVYRVNNTLGGPTAGAQNAFLLLLTFLELDTDHRKLKIILVVLVLVALILNFSRSVWIEIILLTGYLLYKSLKGKTSSFRPREVLYAIIIGGLIIFLQRTSIFVAIQARLSKVSTTESDIRRLNKISYAIGVIKTYNYQWFGTGFGTSYLRSWIPESTKPILKGFSSTFTLSNYYLLSPHNTYLVFLGEIGFVGLLLVFGLFIKYIYPKIKFSNFALFGVFVVLATTMMTETTLFLPNSLYAFAMLLWAGASSTIKRTETQI